MTGGEDPGAPFCAFCGKALGVYEPLVLIGHDRRATRTSRLKHAAEPTPGLMVHEDCFQRRGPWSDTGPG
jgi:hypothetical protein